MLHSNELSSAERIFPQSQLQSINVDEGSTAFELDGISNDQAQSSSRGATLTDEHVALVDNYFSNINNVLPIFHGVTFSERVREQSNVGENCAEICLNAIIFFALQRKYTTNSHNATVNREESIQYIQNALSGADKILLERPSLFRIQALACIVAGRQEAPSDNYKDANLLAIAVRMAYSLQLHRLNEITNVSTVERLEKIRVFWSLYILDRDTSMRDLLPPMIDDDDIYTLDPKLISDDHCGLVVSSNRCHTLNLFTAQQRLSRIESRVWKQLWTFKARHRPLVQCSEAMDDLNSSLERWKERWFDYGSPEDLAALWPTESAFSIVNLQFKYWRCLLRANLYAQYNVDTVKEYAETFIRSVRDGSWSTESVALPTDCVDAARDTLQLARVVRESGVDYLWYVPSRVEMSTVLTILKRCNAVHCTRNDHTVSKNGIRCRQEPNRF